VFIYILKKMEETFWVSIQRFFCFSFSPTFKCYLYKQLLNSEQCLLKGQKKGYLFLFYF